LGFYPDELATGNLRHGAKIELVTGRVSRPAPPEISDELSQQCADVLTEAHQLNVQLDEIIQLGLEQAAWYRSGDPKDVLRKLNAAERELDQRRAALTVKREREAAMPVIVVTRAFRWTAGKRYELGTFKITKEELASLEDWKATMEAQARLHVSEAPAGFTPETWPPYSAVA
jgi:hypothetical protein